MIELRGRRCGTSFPVTRADLVKGPGWYRLCPRCRPPATGQPCARETSWTPRGEPHALADTPCVEGRGMSRQTWKRTERAIAGRLGGVRVPVSGRSRGDAPDVAHPRLAIECKHRRSLPAWLREAMAQAHAAAGPDEIPVAILHEHGRRHADNLCLVRLVDLCRLIEEG